MTKSKQRIYLSTAIIAISGIGLLLAVDLQKLPVVIRRADWGSILSTLIFVFISYLCISYSYAIMARALGINISKRDLSAIYYITSVINHLLTFGGVAGFSMRYLLMNRFGVTLKAVLASSILHFYITSLDMLIMLPVGAAYLLTNAELSPLITRLLEITTILLVMFAIIATLILFITPLRTFILIRMNKLAHVVLRREYSEPLNQFDEALTNGITIMWKKPLMLIVVMILTWIDWISSVIVLGLCFKAFGAEVSPGMLITGYVLGIYAGLISLVPGGLGVQEASMSAIFTLLGTSVEQSVLAALLFRIVYYFIPYFLGVGFYWRLMKHPEVQSLTDHNGGVN